ncbi:hypothetical protein [Paenibacillus sp. MSJ-34]|uniref:hypothetical protein n=1 Tax=Paenibacillus sp. MSJ-34 TaxID=2841529 RepID=UPI001C12534E|nr:hypothetical protein [Paenibacillus sp. MSJ-34]MBU5442960.1 hypothetical protein [Paenibacillus sp. MSJ-34]
MKRNIWMLAFAMLTLLFMSACADPSSSSNVNPAKVQVELIATPEPVIAGETTALTVRITGLNTFEKARVQLDIRTADNKGIPDLLDTETTGNGDYSAEYTFKKTSLYDVYVHLYQGELHITKKKQLEAT